MLQRNLVNEICVSSSKECEVAKTGPISGWKKRGGGSVSTTLLTVIETQLLHHTHQRAHTHTHAHDCRGL